MILLLLQLIPIALFFGMVTLHLAKRPLILLYLLLGIQLLVAGRLLPEVAVSVMGISIGPVDLINIMLLAAAILRMARGPTALQWALLGAIGLVIFGTVRGYLQLGDAALLGFRAELYFLVPALFTSTIRAQYLPRVVRAIVWFGVGLALLAVTRWFGLVPASDDFGGEYLVERVIVSSAALWVALAALAAVLTLFQRVGTHFMRYPWGVAALCLTVVLLAQHRSVWVTTAIMLAIAFLITPHRTLLKVGVVLSIGIAVTLIEGLGLGHGGTVAKSLAFATSNLGTWEWRIERWGDVWETHSARGLWAILFGSGYGYGWATGTVGEWEASPHNGYLQIAVRVGLVGAFLVFLLYYLAIRKLLFAGDPATRLLWLWTIGILVYYIPYSGDMLTGVVLGATIAILTAIASGRQSDSPFSRPMPIGPPALRRSARKTFIAR